MGLPALPGLQEEQPVNAIAHPPATTANKIEPANEDAFIDNEFLNSPNRRWTRKLQETPRGSTLNFSPMNLLIADCGLRIAYSATVRGR